jgi:putative transposase
MTKVRTNRSLFIAPALLSHLTCSRKIWQKILAGRRVPNGGGSSHCRHHLWKWNMSVPMTGEAAIQPDGAQVPQKKKRGVARSKTPSFIGEFPLLTNPADERALRIGLNAGLQIYNAALIEALRRLDLMRQSKAWFAARAMPRFAGEKPDGTPALNKRRSEAFLEVHKKFGFSWMALKAHTQNCRNACWIKDHVGSQEAQALTKRAFKTVEEYYYRKRGRPHVKDKSAFDSVENQTNGCGLRFQNGLFCWVGRAIQIDRETHGDLNYNAAVLACRIKYTRILRREIRGRERWFMQIICEGTPPQRREIGDDDVGISIGPSRIAMVSANDAAFETFCPSLVKPARKLAAIERALNRSSRANNPECYPPNKPPRYKEAVNRSTRYKKLAAKRRERERKLTAERKRQHGMLCNRILGHGRKVHLVRPSHDEFRRMFGRKARVCAPSAFIDQLTRKIAAAGGVAILINPRKVPVAQYGHVASGTILPEGAASLQGNLHSAFLARHCGPETLDVPAAYHGWTGAVQLLRAASGEIQSARGLGFPLPRAIPIMIGNNAGADRAEMAEKQGCETGDAVALIARAPESNTVAAAHACMEHDSNIGDDSGGG